jgi:hypothetical protein
MLTTTIKWHHPFCFYHHILLSTCLHGTGTTLPLPTAYTFMYLQNMVVTKRHITQSTGKLLLLSVSTFMWLQITAANKWFITHITGKWPLPTMYALMYLQVYVTGIWLITHITWKWPFPTVFAQMYHQVTATCIWLSTHITRKWPFPTVFTQICFGCFLRSMIHSTRQRKMAAPHYECVYVLSEHC